MSELKEAQKKYEEVKEKYESLKKQHDSEVKTLFENKFTLKFVK